MTAVSASPTSRACDSTSVSKSVLPTMPSVSRIISWATSIVDPSLQRPHPVGVLGHHRRVGRDAIAVKRRLHQPALPQVHRAFARQQAVAEQPLRALEAAPFDVKLRWWVTSTSRMSAGSLTRKARSPPTRT